MSSLPSSEECTAKTVLGENEHQVTFAVYHPQWGGYCSRATVQAAREIGACFDVSNWHDGEFPTEEGPPMVLHYCDPMQLVDFGLTVLEMQAKHARTGGDEANERIDVSEIEDAITRLEHLILELRKPRPPQ